ncbi:hypothetical protein DQ238_11945 [Geodermatophilus sp. TF02-6]|nr:hypothetical protein DQ238_11945 [Geodermatophilus sp. TF02-6]
MGHDHTARFLEVAPGLVAGEPVTSFREAAPPA